MRYWWVNQNQAHAHKDGGGYLLLVQVIVRTAKL